MYKDLCLWNFLKVSWQGALRVTPQIVGLRMYNELIAIYSEDKASWFKNLTAASGLPLLQRWVYSDTLWVSPSWASGSRNAFLSSLHFHQSFQRNCYKPKHFACFRVAIVTLTNAIYTTRWDETKHWTGLLAPVHQASHTYPMCILMSPPYNILVFVSSTHCTPRLSWASIGVRYLFPFKP